MNFAPLCAVVALSFASVTAQAQSSLGDTAAAQKIAAQLAGHTYLALPSEDQKNLTDSYEDTAAVRQIVFGADGTIAVSLPDQDDDALTDAQALAKTFHVDTAGTWTISVPNTCGAAGCAPLLVITNDQGTTKYSIDLNTTNSDLSIVEFHSESTLHVVK